jgi:cell wall-associated NlpC family hydrolase
MRRGALLILVCGVAALVVASLSSGSEPKQTAQAAPQPQADKAADLPPLPEKLRPKVVEPVAGNGGADAESPVTDPGLEEVGPKPTGPASAGAKRRGSAGSTDITKATALGNGVALPPLEAPEEVKQIIEAGNIIARTPYVWGGGHGKWIDTGYDCSGSVSYALHGAGLLSSPLDSTGFMSYGNPGPGRHVTIYANRGHAFMVVDGRRYDTSAMGETGSRWTWTKRSGSGFVARHPPGL